MRNLHESEIYAKEVFPGMGGECSLFGRVTVTSFLLRSCVRDGTLSICGDYRELVLVFSQSAGQMVFRLY